MTRFGGYATAVNLDARLLHPIPAGWSFAEGAAYPVQALTTWHRLCVLTTIEPGDVVLVHSATIVVRDRRRVRQRDRRE